MLCEARGLQCNSAECLGGRGCLEVDSSLSKTVEAWDSESGLSRFKGSETGCSWAGALG